MYYYALCSIIFFYLGYKLCKSISFMRECRNVKFIEQTVNKVLDYKEKEQLKLKELLREQIEKDSLETVIGSVEK